MGERPKAVAPHGLASGDLSKLCERLRLVETFRKELGVSEERGVFHALNDKTSAQIVSQCP